jgi:hypothetical protein
MSNKKITAILIVLITVAAAQMAAAAPTDNGALTTVRNGNATSTARVAKNKTAGNGQKLMAQIQEKSNKEIDRRLESLDKLSTRVESMKKITEEEKNAVIAQLKIQIGALSALKAKIATATSTASTLEYEKKITNEHRIYALVIPRGYINASVDRINNMALKLEGLSAKLSAKIVAAKSAGNDVSKLLENSTALNAKIAEAKAKANAAKNSVAGLVPDNGDVVKAQANRNALIAARTAIKDAGKDLNSARDAANIIAKELRKLGIKTSVGFSNATSTATTTNTTTTSD